MWSTPICRPNDDLACSNALRNYGRPLPLFAQLGIRGDETNRAINSPQQRLATHPHIVDELEEDQVQRPFLLRDPTMRTEPRTQQRPESLQGVDLHLAGSVLVVIAGELARRVADRLVILATLVQAAVDVIFIGVKDTSLGIIRSIRGPIVTCLTSSSIRITTAPVRCNIPKIGGFPWASVPRPRPPSDAADAPTRPSFLPPLDYPYVRPPHRLRRIRPRPRAPVRAVARRPPGGAPWSLPDPRRGPGPPPLMRFGRLITGYASDSKQRSRDSDGVSDTRESNCKSYGGIVAIPPGSNLSEFLNMGLDRIVL